MPMLAFIALILVLMVGASVGGAIGSALGKTKTNTTTVPAQPTDPSTIQSSSTQAAAAGITVAGAPTPTTYLARTAAF